MGRTNLTGNKGEWGEIYIFFKLLSDKKLYVADKNMNKINDVFLDIVRIIREEQTGKQYSYYTGETVSIKLNGKEISSISNQDIANHVSKIWQMISTESGSFTNEKIVKFLNSIFITKLKSPAAKTNKYFGGTQDITIETSDYRSGIRQIMGFSCKTDLTSGATLFNASKDNTNFVYKLTGAFNDEFMKEFNSLYDAKNHTDIFGRMDFLKKHNINLQFIQPMTHTTEQNLVMACGMEMPAIVGAMLYYYYYVKNGKITYLSECLPWLCTENPVKYNFDNLENVYKYRIQNLLYIMFTGLKMSKPWNGKNEVNGGYIAVKTDGDVVAYHSCIADEFKEFLFDKLRFESPSCSRHQCMSIEKKEHNYYIKFPLQLRFAMNRKET